MPASWPANDMRVLMLAPTSRDRDASCRLLTGARIHCHPCDSFDELCVELRRGAAAVMIPEEILQTESMDRLSRIIDEQPVWSDLPVIVLSHAGAESLTIERAMALLGNVNLLERPVRVSTLISLVRSVLRARERQYQVREHLVEREATESALRDARESAEAANRAKDQFLAVLSHELRTPLSPVVLTVAAMENDPELPESIRADISMIRRNIELEAKLIDDLLDLSRVSSGKLRLNMETVSLHGILRYVFEVCQTDLQAKNVELIAGLAATNDRVHGDPARLQQVFWNLVKNAVKFTPHDQKILVHTDNPKPECLCVRITDTGVGIDAAVLPRLFNAFEQGSPAITRQFGGLGLGLAIAKAVVDLHGGTIHAESAGAGKGATFSVTLHTAQSEPTLSRGPIAMHPTECNGKPRVLLVEDHGDTALVLSRLLSKEGYHVKTAGSVASALHLAGAEPFDVLVSDIGLPDATGYDLMSQIRQRLGLNIKGIALSGYGMEADMQRGRDAGFDDHLVKPVNVNQLSAAIQRVSRG